MVPFIRRRVLDGELMLGIGCVLDSSLASEMAGLGRLRDRAAPLRPARGPR